MHDMVLDTGDVVADDLDSEPHTSMLMYLDIFLEPTH
jgi:hypothetical protein